MPTIELNDFDLVLCALRGAEVAERNVAAFSKSAASLPLAEANSSLREAYIGALLETKGKLSRRIERDAAVDIDAVFRGICDEYRINRLPSVSAGTAIDVRYLVSLRMNGSPSGRPPEDINHSPVGEYILSLAIGLFLQGRLP